MTLLELIEVAREEMADTSVPPQFSDTLLKHYANDAEHEAARRARLLIDSTSNFTEIDLTANEPLIELDPRVVFVRRFKIDGQDQPLARATVQEMDSCRPGWEEETADYPTHFITDYQTGYLRTYPIQTQDLTAKQTVVRLPLKDMANDGDKPEINARYHKSLVHWMKHRALLKKDSDFFDENGSLKALALFEQEFGKKSAAIDEEWIAREQMMEHDGTF